MARIPYRDIDTLPSESRDFILRRGGLNVFRMLSNADELFDGWAAWVDDFFAGDTFSPRLRELVILRVGHLQDSEYEVLQHEDVARGLGIPEPQLVALRQGGDLAAAGFTPGELAILRFVTELLETKHISDMTFRPVYAALGDTATVELLMWIYLYAGLALVLNATEVEIDASARFQVDANG